MLYEMGEFERLAPNTMRWPSRRS